MPRISADILGPLCHEYKNRANCHGYLRISRVSATDISLRSISVALARFLYRSMPCYPLPVEQPLGLPHC